MYRLTRLLPQVQRRGIVSQYGVSHLARCPSSSTGVAPPRVGSSGAVKASSALWLSRSYMTTAASLPPLPSTQTSNRFEIKPEDIMDDKVYAEKRKPEYYPLRMSLRKARRVNVGPYACLNFENYDTLWLQIHEMLWIEKGGDEQVHEEIEAYSPLVPQGKDLAVTFMFEIDNREVRQRTLKQLGHAEKTVYLEFEGEKVHPHVHLDDIDRNDETHGTSSVHFLHFKFSDEQVEKFKGATSIVVGLDHPNYMHMTKLSDTVMKQLKGDLK
eukprot:GFYU01015285.1.p1 GENE.GFYU01015285.1~~GFYU01015285.1.p1  ORF type:complete len:270 (-),score=69.31 GFYU01015285.1:49-858(-)